MTPKARPIGHLFAVVDRADGKSDWLELAPAWANRDGSLGMTLLTQPVAWGDANTPRRLVLRLEDSVELRQVDQGSGEPRQRE